MRYGWFKWPRSWSLQNKIFISILLFLIIPFCVTFYFIDKPLEQTIREKIGQSAQEALHITKLNVEGALNEMMSSVISLTANEMAVSILRNPEGYNDYLRLNTMDNTIKQMYSSYLQYMENNITVVDFNGHLYASWENQTGKYDEIRNSAWFNDILNSGDNFVWVVQEHGFISRNSSRMITVAHVQRKPGSGSPFGVIMSTISVKNFLYLLQGLDGEVLLVGRNGEVLAASDPQAADGALFDDPRHLEQILSSHTGQLVDGSGANKAMVNYTTVGATGWKLIQRIPYDSVFQDIFLLRRINILVDIAIFFLFLLISVTISYSVTRHLKLLRRRMKQVEEGRFNAILTIRGNDEVADLMQTYNTMVTRIRDLIEHVKTEQKHKENMRFKALQAQINPHFLLNTLNNIKWVAYMRQDREVGEMISHLGVIMESSVGKGDDIIPLGEEIQYIRSYIALQKIKYDERIEVDYDIPSDTLQVLVIKFTLQPLVENSIYHGLDKKTGQGRIAISAAVAGDDLLIKVEDNGLGMSPSCLEQLRRTLGEGSGMTTGEKLGLANVHERIRMQFGEPYGIALESREMAGTVITVRIPFMIRRKGDRYAEGADRG